ncbi:8423_t:CDS:2 [Diversispora eburnea]|uniref:protein S-acyltransferase n=1 Tax=Diversispora eburnea TaxID=1213867 RepID=A0A9N8Z6G9_9GLOM|nr:8423_t:CDS:2 [Diversispora eburnea]
MSPIRTLDDDRDRNAEDKNMTTITGGPGLNITTAKATVAVVNIDTKTDNIPNDNLSGMTIHQAAQQGNLHITKHMIENGQAEATLRDSQNITPLHWAAINNHVVVAKYLIDNGAEVDAFGGDLVATPLHWAARNGHLPTVTLLINHGADPNLRDSQGFNGLHLATHSSNSMLVLYLIFQDMDIDTPDTLQHTPLMWAAYQGDPITTELFIRLGADVNKVDSTRFTPLHWAVIKGHPLCIRKLIESGSDINAKEDNGKTPADIAQEMKSDKVWERSLSEAGRKNDGKRKLYLFEKKTAFAIIYLIPFFTLFAGLQTLSHYSWLIGLPLAVAEFFAFHMLIMKVLIRAKLPDALMRTPYFTSLFQASAFWVGVTWIYKILLAVLADPGFVPKLRSREEEKQLVIDLANKGMLDTRHYSNLLLNRLRNHFVQSIAKFVIDVWPVLINFLTSAPKYEWDPSQKCLLNDTLCGFFQFDTWTASLCVWLGLQLTWSVGLLCMQSYQISSAKTTNEMANFHRYSYFGNRTGGNVREQIMATLAAGPGAGGAAQVGDASGDDMSTLDGTDDGFGDHAPHNHNSSGLLRMFGGRDRLHRRSNSSRSHTNGNPFDFGCWNNCVDFWSQGQGGMLQNVDWYGLYDVPLVERRGNSTSRRNGGYMALRRDEESV